LEDAWRNFRSQILEAFPEYDGSELVIAPHLHKVDPDGEGVADEDGDDSVGQAISTVPSLPKIGDVDRGQSGASEARSPSIDGMPLQDVEAVAKLTKSNTDTSSGMHSHGLGGAAAPFLTSGLIGLSDDEARAIRHRLRLRLGALSSAKLVSGKNLHDAVHALGLTRYSIDDINEMVNLVADFINLGFEARDRRSRRQTVFSWETADEVDRYGKPVWEWPKVKDYMGYHRSASLTAFEPQAVSTFNVVPASALMELFLAQDSEIHKRIFGQTGVKRFQAIREILLAGDTNRLVAELTFVRINDLAAPPEPLHPLMYVEPLVAVLIVANGVMIGFQTDPFYEIWEGWAYVELGFALFLFLEIILRLHFLSCRGFWCGEDRLWNWFDVALCSTSIADVSVQFASASPTDIGGRELSLLRFCRLIRLVRIVKVFRLKFMKDLRLMVKGLVAGIRTLVLAFTLLVSVIYVIAGFATMSFGGITGVQVPGVDMDKYFYNLPMSMFTAFRCFTGDCVTDQGFPLTFLLSDEFGLTFAACYIVSYMLVSMGIFNVILAVYVEITMKAAKETEATTAEQYARESIRIARTTRELLKKFAAAFRLFQELEKEDAAATQTGRSSGFNMKTRTGIFTDDDVHDGIAITKELFLLVIQDRGVQQLMDELDLPPDRANLFEVIDADGSGTLHIAELVQGLLKIRGEINKSDTVAALLAAKAVQNILVEFKEEQKQANELLRKEVRAELHRCTTCSPSKTKSQSSQRARPRVANV